MFLSVSIHLSATTFHTDISHLRTNLSQLVMLSQNKEDDSLTWPQLVLLLNNSHAVVTKNEISFKLTKPVNVLFL